ncbi:MAG: response regulator [Candidatus Altiarchaeota archaeon]
MDTSQEILEVLEDNPGGMSTRQLSLKTGHGRATLGKYLELLRVDGKVKYSMIGASKIWSIEGSGSKRILVIEDDPDYIRLIKIVLTDNDYEFIEAEDGEKGLEKVKDMPDLIILDLMLPDIDGFRVCEMIKENALTRDIPVLMLTAKGELEDRLNGLKHGADDYVSKPFSIDDIRSRVESLLDNNRDRNWITNLPGKRLIEEELRKAGELFRVIRVRVDNLDDLKDKVEEKRYRDCVKLVAQTITHEIIKTNDDGFLGHLNENTFIVICREEKVEYIISQLEKDVKSVVPIFCDECRRPLKVSTRVQSVDEFDVNNA